MRITAGRVVMALGLAVAVAGVAWFLMPRPVPVETAAVARGRFVATVDEDGKTASASAMSWLRRSPGA